MFSFVHDLHEPTVFDRRGDIIIIPGYAVYVRRVLRVAASSEAFSVKVVGHVTISYSSSLLVRAIKFRLPAQVISPGSIAAMLVPFSRS